MSSRRISMHELLVQFVPPRLRAHLDGIECRDAPPKQAAFYAVTLAERDVETDASATPECALELFAHALAARAREAAACVGEDAAADLFAQWCTHTAPGRVLESYCSTHTPRGFANAAELFVAQEARTPRRECQVCDDDIAY